MTDVAMRHERAADRRAWILSTIGATGFLSIADLARELRVSQMTIRRDLHTLERTGRVRMVHGGASLSPSATGDQPFPDDECREVRDRVARYATALVDATDTIVVDAGPTGYAFARALPDDFAGSVITHSMPVLQHLVERRPAIHVVALGGEFLTDRRAFVGPTTESSLPHLRGRTFFLAASAVDAEGTYARSAAEASVQRGLIAIVDEVVLVAVHEDFCASAPARIASLDRLTAVVTDRPPRSEVAVALQSAGVVAHVADR